MRTFLGIDPGLSGACALLTLHDGGEQVLDVTPTPVEWVPVGKGKRRRYALDRLNEWFEDHARTISLAYVEAQGARPMQGLASTFQTGFGEGMFHAFLTAHLIPHAVISPQRWRKLTGIPPMPKGSPTVALKTAVRHAAARRFPAFPLRLDHADAVMLAVAAALEYAAEKANGSYA